MSRIVDIEPLLKKYDGMNEGTEFSPIHFINDLMALEQLPFTEKEELLRVGKGAVKARQGRFVIYDVEWLKKNFYSTEEKIYGQPKQPCEDCVSRADVKEQMLKYGFKAPDMTVTEFVEDCLSPVTPTSEDIKEAYDKGYEYGVKEWFEKRTKSQTCIEDYPTCTECEHYDKEKHYCPRFCQVIKDTLAEAQPSEDCISREAVIELIGEDYGKWLPYAIMELPPVTPQRPKGKWVEVFVETPNDPYSYGFKSHKCSKCEYSPLQISNYCPNCGAEMSGGGEDV